MLFGYDIGVISGAENLLKSTYHLGSGTEELAVAAVLIGAVVGGVIGGPLANRFSRRYTLLAMAIVYGVGAILTSISFSLGSFIAFRILTGIAVGASALVVPMYIAEMAHRDAVDVALAPVAKHAGALGRRGGGARPHQPAG
jgi:MFS family permease